MITQYESVTVTVTVCIPYTGRAGWYRIRLRLLYVAGNKQQPEEDEHDTARYRHFTMPSQAQ